ncbi:MAG: transcriptional regulator [Oscillospiraceae bacterium]|nr:transcriptional regulator [Oscillospiraceae bacterium]
MLDNMILKSSQMVLLAQSDGCCVYQMKNETGDGTMTVYDLFPGVMLAYNDYHMEHCLSEFETTEDLLCIDHCREGRLEYSAKDTAYSYVEAGDLKIDRRLKHTGHFSFPLSHYHGITVSLQLSEAARALPEEFRDFPVDLHTIRRKFCDGASPMVLHGAPSIDHIFNELYAVPEKIKRAYFKIKVLELLLYLDALELPKTREDRPYFYKSQVEKIKSMQALMVEHLERRYTMEELSSQFGIPLTPMKNCFKSVYGSPINTYMRIFRMNRAAVLLRQQTSIGVSEIAGRVGYDSPSKFASAFKDVMGKAPLEYRRDLR